MKPKYLLLPLLLASSSFLQADAASAKRIVQSLDGVWQIAEGNLTAQPKEFNRTVQVPGLVDMSRPAFAEPGPKVPNRNMGPQKDTRRDAFWYRRSFAVKGALPTMATIKVGKAMFGTRVILNGKLLGDHPASFTAGFFDAASALKSGENELVIRIGADPLSLPASIPSGFDFEKERYIPGIFDSIELILSNTPSIENVQVVPDLKNSQARVRVWLKGSAEGDVMVEVREAKSGKTVGKSSARMTAASDQELNLVVPISGCRYWSPEDPFLYELTAQTSGDEFKTWFGMREFKFDPATGHAVLNGKPYFMRGSNITLYRFFEDPERGNLPWDEGWVRLLHQRVKDMHWNCLRYCIGFPPEAWYRIADEEGILIQDEFPLWNGGAEWSNCPKTAKTEELVKEYSEWMRERWNHPSVVIWDASNETTSDETVAAIRQVRALDLSARPWDNSYMPPAQPGDAQEEHPYHFMNEEFKLPQIAGVSPAPWKNSDGFGVIINEYGWLWLNRDGTPTTLTQKLYENLLGKDSTTEQRRHLYARYLAVESEFWRSYRKAAAVMHFTTLGYSRKDGQTSDHWLDLKNLVWEPEFYNYVRDSFAPVGVMLDYFAERDKCGRSRKITVAGINDLYDPWAGAVVLSIQVGERVVSKVQSSVRIEALGRTNIVFDVKMPDEPGKYTIEAELRNGERQPVRSVREVTLELPGPGSLTTNCVATASSLFQPGYRPENAVDDNEISYWSSAFEDHAWLSVDLGALKNINRVTILWEGAFAKSFALQVSADGQTWSDVYKTDIGKGGTSEISFAPVEARHVRVMCTKRGTEWGNAIRELQVFQTKK